MCTSVVLSYKAPLDMTKTSDAVSTSRKWKIRELGSTAACPGPAVGAAPSSRRSCCTRDTPTRRKRCPQSTTLERNVPPARWGGSTCKTQTHHWVAEKQQHNNTTENYFSYLNRVLCKHTKTCCLLFSPGWVLLLGWPWIVWSQELRPPYRQTHPAKVRTDERFSAAK